MISEKNSTKKNKKTRKLFILFCLFTNLYSFGSVIFLRSLSSLNDIWELRYYPLLILIFCPLLLIIQRPLTQKITLSMCCTAGFTIAMTYSESLSIGSNLWPFTLFIAPVYASPIIMLYLVIVHFLERIIARELFSSASVLPLFYARSGIDRFFNWQIIGFVFSVPVGLLIDIFDTTVSSGLTKGLVIGQAMALLVWAVGEMILGNAKGQSKKENK